MIDRILDKVWQKDEFQRMKRKYSLYMGLWGACVLGSFTSHAVHDAEAVEDIARNKALVAFERDTSFREYIASHGGVYVPVTGKTPPNQFLDVPNRDVEINGRPYTLMNPAYAMRQRSEFYQEKYANDISIPRTKITSLNLTNPVNEPTEKEREILEMFERGVDEFGEFVNSEEGERYFFAKPFMANESCLKCHADYDAGDVRGGIFVELDVSEFRKMQYNELTSVGLWHLLIGLSGIGLGVVAYRRDKMGMIGVHTAAYGHDLANTMTAIQGGAQLLRMDLEDAGVSENEHIKGNMAQLTYGVARANQLLGNIRMFSKTGNVKLDEEPQDLCAIVTSAIQSLHVMYPSAAIEYVGENCAFVGDHSTYNAIINIGKNAIEAGAKTLRFSVGSENAYAFVKISDDGPGMDKKTLKHLFHPFFTEKGKGIGIGLANAKAIVAAQGGKITVRSGDEGSTFELYLPEADN